MWLKPTGRMACGRTLFIATSVHLFPLLKTQILTDRVEKLIQNPNRDGWTVLSVRKGDGSSRTLKPRHFIFAHGFGGGVPNMPTVPGAVSAQGFFRKSS